MKERIIQIMEAEHLTPSLFADKLNIGRAVISHILNGRNNPSLDVVIRILNTMDYVDADWLLSGKGSMRKNDNISQILVDPSPKPIPQTIATDLFASVNLDTHNTNVNPPKSNLVEKEKTSIKDETISSLPKEAINKQETIVNTMQQSDKEVKKVIIYYSDKTFQAFSPDDSSF